MMTPPANLVVLRFTAPWCAPCRVLAPLMADLIDCYESEVEFVTVDVDKEPETPEEYKVRSIPTVLFIHRGEEVKRITGVKDREAYERILKIYK